MRFKSMVLPNKMLMWKNKCLRKTTTKQTENSVHTCRSGFPKHSLQSGHGVGRSDVMNKHWGNNPRCVMVHGIFQFIRSFIYFIC